jgi:hypothetical protein
MYFIGGILNLSVFEYLIDFLNKDGFRFLFLDSFLDISIKKNIIRSLINLILISKIVILALLFHFVISKRYKLDFESSRSKFAIINISIRKRDHLINIKILFFTQLIHFSEIFRSLYLSV